MEFTLYYNDELPSTGNVKDKHHIRLSLYPQLKVLWNQDPLKSIYERAIKERIDNFIKKVGDYYYLPIIRKDYNMYGELDIIMLRRGMPGELISGGDIDNRLKTLFDGLRMPNNPGEVIPIKNNSFDNPFYCVFEDDRLITSVKVNTMQYLNSDSKKNVILIANIKTLKTATRYITMDL